MPMPIEYASVNFNIMDDLEILRREREIERSELQLKGKKAKKGK